MASEGTSEELEAHFLGVTAVCWESAWVLGCWLGDLGFISWIYFKPCYLLRQQMKVTQFSVSS